MARTSQLTRTKRELAELTTAYNQIHAQRDRLLYEKHMLENDLAALNERFARSEANFARAVDERNDALAAAHGARPELVSAFRIEVDGLRSQLAEKHGRAEELRSLTTLLLSRLIGE